MSIRDRLSACLDSHKSLSHCARCIAEELGLAPKSIYQSIRDLTWLPGAKFAREKGKCRACGKLGMVIRRAAHPMWITH